MNKYGIAKRQYIKYGLAVLVNALAYVFVALIMLLGKSEELTLTQKQIDMIGIGLLSIGGLVLIFGLIIAWIIVKKKKFYVEDKEFVVEQGWIFKRITKVSFEKMYTISIKRNLLDLILGLSKLEVDSGSAMSIKAEISLNLDKNYALVLKSYLEEAKEGNISELPNPESHTDKQGEVQNHFHQANFRELFLSGILGQSIYYMVLILIIWSSMALVSMRIEPEGPLPHDMLVIGTFFLIVIVILLCIGLGNMIAYYKYRVIVKDNHIEYSYGLLNKKSFKVDINKIDGIYLKQPLLYRVFKRYIVEASIIGIGELNQNNNNDGESKKLLLFASKEKVQDLLNLLNIQTIESRELKRPNKLKIFNFMVIPLVIITLLVLPLPIFLSKYFIEYISIFMMGIILYGLVVTQFYLNMKQKGYGINDKFLVVSKGGFTQTISITKVSRIQSIVFKQGPILMLEKLGSIQMTYRGFGKTRTINYYDISSYEEIKRTILK